MGGKYNTQVTHTNSECVYNLLSTAVEQAWRAVDRLTIGEACVQGIASEATSIESGRQYKNHRVWTYVDSSGGLPAIIQHKSVIHAHTYY